jgi:hypothetical protein
VENAFQEVIDLYDFIILRSQCLFSDQIDIIVRLAQSVDYINVFCILYLIKGLFLQDIVLLIIEYYGSLQCEGSA